MLKNKYKTLFHLILTISVLVFGIRFYWISILGKNLEFLPGDWGDGRFNNFILEHGYMYLSGKVQSFWDAPFFFPMKNAIALSDNLLGSLPFYAMFRKLGYNIETSFQLWIIFVTCLNYLAAFFVLHKWTKNTFASIAGAYIFAFAVANNSQIFHVQVIPKFVIPIAYYFALEWIKTPNNKNFLLLNLAIVYQFYCGIYLGFLLIFTLIFFFIVAAFLIDRNQFYLNFKTTKNIALHFLSVLISALLLLILFIPYIQIKKVLSSDFRNWDQIIDTIPTLQSYFFSHGSHLQYSFLSSHYLNQPLWWDQILFLGLIPILTFLFLPVFLYKTNTPNKTNIKLLYFTTILVLVFSTKFGHFSLYYIFFKYVPGFSALGTLSRIIFPVLWLFAVLVAFMIAELQFKNFYKNIVFSTSVVALIIFDQFASYLPSNNGIIKFESYELTELIVQQIDIQRKTNHKAFAWLGYKDDKDAVKLQNLAMIASQKS